MSEPSATVLDRILERTRADLEARRGLGLPPAVQPPGGTRSFASALAAPGISVIAEFKRRSPSAGALHRAPDLARIVAAYEAGGAAAVSVLTDEPHFGGTLADLAEARSACSLPLLRKDFMLEPFQLEEARAAGADAALLIVAALEQSRLAELCAAASELGLDALVEVHDEHELERAALAGARIIGVNNRDLRDFSVDLARTERLLGAMPDGALVVSESGIANADQLRRLAQLGVAAVLVGEALMRAEDPARALERLRSS